MVKKILIFFFTFPYKSLRLRGREIFEFNFKMTTHLQTQWNFTETLVLISPEVNKILVPIELQDTGIFKYKYYF